MNILFVVDNFLLGTSMDIGCTIGTTEAEAVGGASRAGWTADMVVKLAKKAEAQPAAANRAHSHP